MTKIVFLHGLEGTATGSKPTWLKERGYDVTAPVLDTSRLIQWLSTRSPSSDVDVKDTIDELVRVPRAAAAAAVAAAKPDVVVGSSFGGGLAMTLIRDGVWNGPAVLLAPAGKKLFGIETLASSSRIAVLHGRGDDVVPCEDSVALATASTSTDITLRLVDDDHRLLASVAAGLMGALVELVLAR